MSTIYLTSLRDSLYLISSPISFVSFWFAFYKFFRSTISISVQFGTKFIIIKTHFLSSNVLRCGKFSIKFASKSISFFTFHSRTVLRTQHCSRKILLVDAPELHNDRILLENPVDVYAPRVVLTFVDLTRTVFIVHAQPFPNGFDSRRSKEFRGSKNACGRRVPALLRALCP